MSETPVEEPTSEGCIRYEGGFYEDYPCTCDKLCPPDCKGTCGCKACAASYSDFLSTDYE